MKKKNSIGQIIIKYRIILILVILAAIFTALKPVFLNPTNLLNMVKRMSYTAVCAFGMTFLLTLGVFDMSAGSNAALIGVLLAWALEKGWSVAWVLPAVILLAIFFGWLNGFITVKGKIAAFLTTLATMNIYRGIAQTMTEGRTVSIKLKGLTNFFGNGTFLGIPTPIYITIIFFAIALFLFYKTKYGFYCRCIGGNEEAAKVAGIAVDKIKMTAFSAMGFCAGISGLILASLMNGGMPNLAQDLAMDGISASVLGGTAISGGLGTMWGTIGGTLIMAIINTGLSLLGAQTPVQLLVKGFVIIGAILMDNALKNREIVVEE